MSANSEKGIPVSATADPENSGTFPFFHYVLIELRDDQMMKVVATFLESAPKLRDALPRLEGTAQSEPLKHLLNTYDYLGVLSGVEMNPRLLGEYIVTRGADNFRCYLADILTAIFRARPETLRSSDKVNVEDVLMCASIDEFVSRMADRKAEQLSYNGVLAVIQFMSDRLGLAIDLKADCIQKATEAIAVRNIVVHNRGLANERFLRLTGRQDLKVKDPVPITYEFGKIWRTALFDSAKLIDRAVYTVYKNNFID